MEDNPVILACEEAIKESNLLKKKVLIFSGTRYGLTSSKRGTLENILPNLNDDPCYEVSVRRDGRLIHYYLLEHEFRFI